MPLLRHISPPWLPSSAPYSTRPPSCTSDWIGGSGGIGVEDQRGARLRQIRTPDLCAVHTIIGFEAEPGATGHELGRRGLGGAGVDIFDHARAGARAVTLPQFRAMRPVISLEDQPAAKTVMWVG